MAVTAHITDRLDATETVVCREVEEETGYRARSVCPLCDLFMSPGSVTERGAFFVADTESFEQPCSPRLNLISISMRFIR